MARTTDHLFKVGRIFYGWYWITEPSGERRQIKRSTGCTDRERARQVVAEWERDQIDPDALRRRNATLSDAIDPLIRERRSLAASAEKANERAGRRVADGSDSTVTFYESCAAALYLHAGKRAVHVKPTDKLSRERKTELRELGKRVALLDVGTKAFVDEMILARREEGASQSTIAKNRMMLRQALTYAKGAGLWVGDLDIVIPRGFKVGYEPRRTSLTLDQTWTLVRALPSNRGAVVAFIVATSAEKAAVERAQADDVRKGAEYVTVRGTKRRQRHRVVGVVTEWQRDLLDFVHAHADRTETGKLFSPWVNMHRDIPLYAEKAGLPHVSPNDLRRTYATLMRQEGIPLDQIAPDMGHNDTSMLQRIYARLTPEQLADEKRKIIATRATALRLKVVEGGKAG